MSVILLRRWPYPRPSASRLAVCREYLFVAESVRKELVLRAEYAAVPLRIDGWFTEIDGIEMAFYAQEQDSFFFRCGDLITPLETDVTAAFNATWQCFDFSLFRKGSRILQVRYRKIFRRLLRPWDVVLDFLDDSHIHADPLCDLADRMSHSDGLNKLLESLQPESGAFEVV